MGGGRELARCCVRVLPHLNDTGGFFVAVFVKTAEVDHAAWAVEDEDDHHDVIAAGRQVGNNDAAEEVLSSREEEAACGVQDHPPVEQAEGAKGEAFGGEENAEADPSGYNSDGRLQFKHMQLTALSPSHSTWQELSIFYGLPPTGSASLPVQSLVETQGGKQGCRITLTTPLVVDFLASLSAYTRVRVVNFGLRCFKKLHHGFLKEAACRWYPCKDAAHILWGGMTRRRIEVDTLAMQLLLSEREVSLEEWRRLEEEGSVRGLRSCRGEDGKWQTGGVLVGLPSSAGGLEEEDDDVLCLPCVLTAKAVQLNADKEDIRSAKAQLGVEDVRRPRESTGLKRSRDDPPPAGGTGQAKESREVGEVIPPDDLQPGESWSCETDVKVATKVSGSSQIKTTRKTVKYTITDTVTGGIRETAKTEMTMEMEGTGEDGAARAKAAASN